MNEPNRTHKKTDTHLKLLNQALVGLTLVRWLTDEGRLSARKLCVYHNLC